MQRNTLSESSDAKSADSRNTISIHKITRRLRKWTLRSRGHGSDHCEQTIALMEKLAQAAGVAVDFVQVTSPDEIQGLGATSTPAVFIDGKLVHSGGIPSQEKVVEWFEAKAPGFLHQPTRHLFLRVKAE